MNLLKIVGIFCLMLGSKISAMENKPSNASTKKPLGIYFGGFGGWGFSSADVSQKGMAFLPASSGGTLSVDAKGSSKDSGFGFGGLHLGYEWNGISYIVPAIELEGFYYAGTQKADDLVNDSIRLSHHDFSDTFPMRVGTILVNGLIAYSNQYLIPYLGVGVGAGITSIHDADSKQIKPLEVGINHFNSDTSSSNTTFACQAKGGFRFPITTYFRPFIEYRFLYFSPLNYTFGSTQYPTHSSTSSWEVRFSQFYQNLFSVGMDFTF